MHDLSYRPSAVSLPFPFRSALLKAGRTRRAISTSPQAPVTASLGAAVAKRTRKQSAAVRSSDNVAQKVQDIARERSALERGGRRSQMFTFAIFQAVYVRKHVGKQSFSLSL